MKTQFFLYDFSLEDKQRFLDKIVSNLDDLIFVFELNSFKIVFHNNSFNHFSSWESIVASPNFFDAIRALLSPNDLPVLFQIPDAIQNFEKRDFLIRDLHIKNKLNFYSQYQIEMTLFDQPVAKPVQILCKVQAVQEQTNRKKWKNNELGFSKVILVDDDVLTNILNEKIIKAVQEKMEVLVFINIEEALLWLKEFDTAGDCLIFLDINFPGKNGWDFIKEYNEYQIQSAVIVLSSSVVPGDREKALAYESVIQFMSKPLSFEIVDSLLN